LSAPAATLDLERIRAGLAGDPFVASLEYREEIDSTNDAMKRLGAGAAPSGSVLIAGRQTAGRGRLGREWHSPPRHGLYLSVLLRPTAPSGEWTRWTLGAAVAAAEACRACGGRNVIVKWPNDLLHGGRKVGGLLAEMRSPATGGGELILGLGLNVERSTDSFPGSLSETAVSLEEIATGETPRREDLAAVYLRELGRIHRSLEDGRWDEVARRWVALAPQSTGRRVRVAAAGGDLSYHGTTAGLDPSGALLVVRDDDGETIAVRDVCSIRALE
jgi:BirA family biotin operon repressor/biotin-[acetyl-CoA-carboxylase] ligase